MNITNLKKQMIETLAATCPSATQLWSLCSPHLYQSLKYKWTILNQPIRAISENENPKELQTRQEDMQSKQAACWYESFYYKLHVGQTLHSFTPKQQVISSLQASPEGPWQRTWTERPPSSPGRSASRPSSPASPRRLLWQKHDKIIIYKVFKHRSWL